MGCCAVDVNGGARAGGGGNGGGGGVAGAIVAVDISGLANVQGAWNFEGNLNDRSANNLPLTVAAGTAYYQDLVGKQCVYVATASPSPSK